MAENDFNRYARGCLARARAKYTAFDNPNQTVAILGEKVRRLEPLASSWNDDRSRRLFLLRLAELAALVERAAFDLELLEELTR